MNLQVFISTKTLAKKDGNVWVVVSDIVQGRRNLESDPWDTRTISIKSIDKSLTKAHDLAKNSLDREFNRLNQDLFEIPKEKDGTYIPYPA